MGILKKIKLQLMEVHTMEEEKYIETEKKIWKLLK